MELIPGNGGGEQGEGKARVLTLHTDRTDYHPVFSAMPLSLTRVHTHIFQSKKNK